MENVILCIVLTGLTVMFLYCVYQVIYKIPLELKRNNNVYKFRMWVFNNHTQYYQRLPSYREMLEDGKKLELESYIPELKKEK